MRPPLGVDADRGPDVHLVVILEPLRPHVPPPLDVFRLPVLERALQALVAREVYIVRNLLGRDHEASLTRSQRSTKVTKERLRRPFVSFVILCVLCERTRIFQ